VWIASAVEGEREGACCCVRPPLRPTVKMVGLWPLKLRWRKRERLAD